MKSSANCPARLASHNSFAPSGSVAASNLAEQSMSDLAARLWRGLEPGFGIAWEPNTKEKARSPWKVDRRELMMGSPAAKERRYRQDGRREKNPVPIAFGIPSMADLSRLCFGMSPSSDWKLAVYIKGGQLLGLEGCTNVALLSSPYTV